MLSTDPQLTDEEFDRQVELKLLRYTLRLALANVDKPDADPRTIAEAVRQVCGLVLEYRHGGNP